jgi:hypothetical protein
MTADFYYVFTRIDFGARYMETTTSSRISSPVLIIRHAVSEMAEPISFE